MAVPTSAIFTVLDWNQRAATTADAGDALITDPTSGWKAQTLVVDTNTSYSAAGLLLRANATKHFMASPVLATSTLYATVSSVHTFEVDMVLPADVPIDFMDQDNRIFIGAINLSNYTSGFLFSKQGIGVCSSPFSKNENITTLQGSSKYMWDADGNPIPFTLRAVVDDDKRLNVYLTPTEETYELGTTYGYHKLAYNVPAIESSLPASQILLAIRSKGPSATDYQLLIKSLRLENSKVSTPNKPVAKVLPPQTTTVGRKARLDGRESYDPENTALSFEWEIEESPKGSTTKLSGGTSATAQFGTAAANNQFTITHKGQTSKVNKKYVRTIKGSTTAPLSLSYKGDGTLEITLATDSAGNAVTTADEIVHAFTKPSADGYVQSVSDVFTAQLDSNLGTGVVVVEEKQLAGGAGSASPRTSHRLDKPGTYRYSLRVNNGSLYSDPVIQTVQATHGEQLLSHRPKSDYLFMSLPDFWDLVEDKSLLSTSWSAFTQIISADLLKLMQNDYAKSIRDITRKYQRRWLHYPMRIPVPSALSDTLDTTVKDPVHAYIKPDSAHISSTSTNLSFNSTINTGRLVDPSDGSAALTTEVSLGKGVILDASGYHGKVNVVKQSATTPYDITISSNGMNAVRIVDSGSHGFFLQDPAAADTQTNMFSSRGTAIKRADLKVGDILILIQDGVYYARTINKIPAVDTSGANDVPIKNAIEWDAAEGKLTADGTTFQWQIVRKVSFSQLVQGPYFNLGGNVDLRTLEFSFGDSAEISYNSPLTNEAVTAYVPIIHTTSNEIFLDWRPFIHDMSVILGLTQTSETPRFEFKKNEDLLNSIRLVAVHRTERVPLRDDVLSIPRLGEGTVGYTFSENTEYEITNNRLELFPVDTFNVTVTKGSSSVYVDKDLTEVKSIILTEGEIGSYAVTSFKERKLETTHTFKTSGTYTARIPRYSFNQDLPERLWAEITYFDNYQVIEDNFGILVGLPKSAVESLDVDYLSLVKATWFAFMHGPSVNNIKMAAEAFMGLPYAEEEGRVTVLEPNHTTTLGRIVIKTAQGFSTYYYDNSYPISTNPTTNRQIKAVTVAQAKEWELTAKTQATLQKLIDDPKTPSDKVAEYKLKLKRAQDSDDAKVPAFTALTDAVRVWDYVSNPKEAATIFTGDRLLEKFHTFVIEVPTKALTGTYVKTLKTFVEEWKPEHTDVIFFGVHNVVDSIAPTERFLVKPTVRVRDGLFTTPWTQPSGSNTLTWPDDETLKKGTIHPGEPAWDYANDVHDKYESGYVAGVTQDYSGDGSWNERHKVVDMVNSVNPDVDVINSKMWVPIDKTADNLEFVVGEEIELLDASDTPITTHWTTNTYPIVEHVGAGTFQKIMFDAYNPQNTYPKTYLWLGFYKSAGENLGSESRLMAMEGIAAATTIKVRGRTSGAKATVKPVRGYTDANNAYPHFTRATTLGSTDHAVHKRYFRIERMFYVDQLWEVGPRIKASLFVTSYIPNGGKAYGSMPAAFTAEDMQVQMHPYDTSLADNAQLVPSYSPGFFHNWDVVTSSNIRWGYTFAGPTQDQDVNASPTGTFHQIVGAADLGNIHIGYKKNAWPYEHAFQGFTSFYVPEPRMVSAQLSTGGNYVRFEGWYLLDDDSTRTAIPTASTFDGTQGGCWVVFKNRATSVEYNTSYITFKTGYEGVGYTVLGAPGTTHRSDGHVVEAGVPGSMPDGTYDVIFRQYRPYKAKAADPVTVEVFTFTYESIYIEFGTATASAGGLGASAHGVSSFGGAP